MERKREFAFAPNYTTLLYFYFELKYLKHLGQMPLIGRMFVLNVMKGCRQHDVNNNFGASLTSVCAKI